jgi:phosphatidylinositol alpha 1,6-mannosyltransferase
MTCFTGHSVKAPNAGMPHDTKVNMADNLNKIRIALFSGNYNYVRDGANQALNRLVEYLIRMGAAVRVYSPTTDTPAFEPQGDLVSVPSWPIPGRGEYRFPKGLPRSVRKDLESFAPNILHLSSPDLMSHKALKWARHRDIPCLASVHTRFETYPRYYNMAFLEPLLLAFLRRFYRRCDAIVAPAESMAQVLREQRMNYDVGIWSRGVDRTVFHSDRRDMAWRRSLGIADDEPVIGFTGRLVMEKGLDVFSETIELLERRRVQHRVLVVGDGPARPWFEARLDKAVFAGFQEGANLGRAVASMDMLFNPSVTETFGNVTLEAMACGLPVVAAQATGSQSLVTEGVSGRLIRPGATGDYADALALYCTNSQVRETHGQHGADRAENFSWDSINGTLAETYLRIIRQRERGSRGVPNKAIR